MNDSRIEHCTLKILTMQHGEVNLSAAVALFHRWIQEDVRPELLIDVVDYLHVVDGPGVILVGHEADYSLDVSNGRLGLQYSRKAPLGVDLPKQLRQAYASALRAAARFEAEPEFVGKLAFDAGAIDLIINDRLLAPNTAATLEVVGPVAKGFFREWLGVEITAKLLSDDPRERFGLSLRAATPIPVREALHRLNEDAS
jgi:hypothetical protein